MKIAIIGGKLQGVEAAYLARKAGWEIILIDREHNVPAIGLSDVFIQLDIRDNSRFNEVLKDVKIIIPATENIRTLYFLDNWSKDKSIPVLFDLDSYSISSSKIRSDILFSDTGLPVPEPWPDCDFPVIAKPSDGSGSKGVKIFQDLDQLTKTFSGSIPPTGWVIQEYMDGPSYSLEVVGVPGDYETLQVTDLEMDTLYDCKRVTAPTKLSRDLVKQFRNISVQIAEAVRLRGLMDVEVILHKGKLKVLEIDARLPSQTPTVVYRSGHGNILKKLSGVFGVEVPVTQNELISEIEREKGVIYEHVKINSGTLDVCGEHIMSETGILYLQKDFFGADEAITDYMPDKENWVATLIIIGNDYNDAWNKREQIISRIIKYFKLDLIDS